MFICIFYFCAPSNILCNIFCGKIIGNIHTYVFRSNHSTELAALILVDELTYKLDRGIIPMNIYIDLCKQGRI